MRRTLLLAFALVSPACMEATYAHSDEASEHHARAFVSREATARVRLIESESAGVSPATMVAPQTKQVLAEWNLQIDDQFPKGLEIIRHQPFDLIVNMSGIPLAPVGMRVVNWAVPDPMGQRDAIHRSVAVQLEGMVMQLILELRTAAKSK